MDNRVVALQGTSLDGSIPIIFPAEAFERITVRVHRLPIIVGAAGHGAAPPVFRAGPQRFLPHACCSHSLCAVAGVSLRCR